MFQGSSSMTRIHSKSFSKSKLNLNRGTAVLSILIVVALLLTGFAYLIQTNGVVSQTYQLRQTKERVKKLQTENSAMQIKAVQLGSPTNLEELAQKLGMVEADKAVYLKAKGAVAVNSR